MVIIDFILYFFWLWNEFLECCWCNWVCDFFNEFIMGYFDKWEYGDILLVSVMYVGLVCVDECKGFFFCIIFLFNFFVEYC